MDAASLLYNLHPEPIPGYKFMVYIQNVAMGFSKVTNIENSIETEPLQEGGVNDRVYSLRHPQSAERTMTFERGTVFSTGALQMLLTFRFAVGQRLPEDIMILVMGRNGIPAKTYFVHGAVVKKCAWSDLNAMSGELLMERFEIVYETLESF